jgi:site-specific DNA recombinase
MSPLKIVTELNALQVSAPGAAYRRQYNRKPPWSAAALHGDLTRGTGHLNNPLYVGRYVWNRSRHEKDPDTNCRAHMVRDKSEWIETPMPHLRIIDDELWERGVSQGVAALRASLHCRARSTGASPKYLFSGLLVCGQCGGKFVICEKTKYGSSTWRTRGESVCPNAIKVPRKLVESLLLESIQRDLFTEEGLDVFKQEVARLLAEQRRTKRPELANATKRLKAVEAEIEHIMKAIKAGIVTVTTKTALEQAETERAQLIEAIQGQHKMLDKVTTLLPNIAERFRKLVDDLATVTQHQVDKARGILMRLVGGEIVLHPSAEGEERYLTAELSGDYSGIVGLVDGPKLNLVAVTRIERVTRGL